MHLAWKHQPYKMEMLEEIPVDFNWNASNHPLTSLPDRLPAEPTAQQVARTELFSECLRDGLHGTEQYPSVEKRLHYIAALQAFGIKHAMVGIYPGEDNYVDASTRRFLALLRDQFPSVIPTVLSLCTPASLKWSLLCKDIHPGLEVGLFMGSAPSRRLVQGWDMSFICCRLASSISEAVRHGITVVGATEHTTQTPPEDIAHIVRVQVENGAYRIIIADTIGIARPRGAYRIVRFVRHLLDDMGAKDVHIDWHGHRDTGNALTNALMAVAAGAQRVHVVARGIGERAGNMPLEDIALNFHTILKEAGIASPWQLSQLLQLLSSYEDLIGVRTPEYGVLAKRYNHTSLGIHTDAILKANRIADEAGKSGNHRAGQKFQQMARTIYSAIDPQIVGGRCSVGVSQWSGRSSVQLAYRYSGGDPDNLTAPFVDAILAQAKELGRELTQEELNHSFSIVSSQTPETCRMQVF